MDMPGGGPEGVKQCGSRIHMTTFDFWTEKLGLISCMYTRATQRSIQVIAVVHGFHLWHICDTPTYETGVVLLLRPMR